MRNGFFLTWRLFYYSLKGVQFPTLSICFGRICTEESRLCKSSVSHHTHVDRKYNWTKCFLYLISSLFCNCSFPFSVPRFINTQDFRAEVFVTSRHGDHPMNFCSKYCNKYVCCNLVAWNLKILKRRMKGKNISVVISAGEKVCFCVFHCTIVPEWRRG